MKRLFKYTLCTTLAGMAAGSVCGLVLGMSESATLFVDIRYRGGVSGYSRVAGKARHGGGRVHLKGALKASTTAPMMSAAISMTKIAAHLSANDFMAE
jgi:hypothetical protein